MHPAFSDDTATAVAEVIRTRRTIHLFDPDRIPARSEILAAMELARWAPNHYLTEPWRFYLLGRETAEAIARLNAEQIAASRGEAAAAAKLERWLAVPGWLVVTSRRSGDARRDREDYAACCCAVQNIQLYLWSRGIGTKWTTGDVTQSEHFYELIGVDPDRERLVSMLWYGYPADIPSPPRKPLEEIVVERP